jgi:hypothetical protein
MAKAKSVKGPVFKEAELNQISGEILDILLKATSTAVSDSGVDSKLTKLAKRHKREGSMIITGGMRSKEKAVNVRIPLSNGATLTLGYNVGNNMPVVYRTTDSRRVTNALMPRLKAEGMDGTTVTDWTPSCHAGMPDQTGGDTTND